jgi:hypothetical protein
VKKLFFIFLLIMLPLQSSWAAAASYCQHEQTSTHFGHHAHQHETQSDTSDTSTSTNAHSDCGYCHLFCQASFMSAPLNMIPPNGPIVIAAVTFHFSSHIPDGPKPPDWRLVV